MIQETVERLETVEKGFALSGHWGTVTAARVLLATGAFGSELLGSELLGAAGLGSELLVDRRPRTVLMAGLAVALAGNGSAAKSSDEIGRLASSLFTELGWDNTIDAATFTPRFR